MTGEMVSGYSVTDQLKEKRIGVALTGSYCTFDAVLPVIQAMVQAGALLFPIMSETSYTTDTRFGTAAHWQQTLVSATGQSVWHTIAETEPIGPKQLLDLLIVAPCTGNTLAKLAHGITDSSVTMACKAHLRNGRPLLLALSTNDGLHTAATNIGLLQTRKHVFFVPYGQDDAQKKPQSLVAKMEQIPKAAVSALQGTQLQPILCS